MLKTSFLNPNFPFPRKINSKIPICIWVFLSSSPLIFPLNPYTFRDSAYCKKNETPNSGERNVKKMNQSKQMGKLRHLNMADGFGNQVMSPQSQKRKPRERRRNSCTPDFYHKSIEFKDDVDDKVVSVDIKRRNKALLEFRSMVEEAILRYHLLDEPINGEEITLWGIPLMPSKCHAGTNIVLLKFLKAKHFNVDEAFEMLRNTLKWRSEFRINGISQENLDLGLDSDKVAYLNSRDKKGHPLVFNICGDVKDKQMLYKILDSEDNYLRWRIQMIEKAIKELKFENGGVDSIVQIIDLKNSPKPASKELRALSEKAWMLIQDNYPDLIHQNIIINVPLWYYVSTVFSSRLKTENKNGKIVFARPGKATETLLKYISPENLPVEYGGLHREDENEFFPEHKVLELRIRANATDCIQIPAYQAGVTLIWEFIVVGWNVSYTVEFVPYDEGSYRVMIQKEKDYKKGGSVRNSFYIREPGNIIVTIHNFFHNKKKKKVFYRYKTRPTVPIYVFYNK